MADVSAMSFTQSSLVYYNTSGGNPGIYIEWERSGNTNVYAYSILRSDQFDGTYTEIDSVYFPINEYVDSSGKPTNYYKIAEYDSDANLLNTSGPINGDELLIKSSLRFELEHLLNIPIYDEEVIFHKDRSRASVAFPFWNYYPRPEIRITGLSEDGDRESMIPLSDTSFVYKTINPDYDPILYYKDGTVAPFTGGNNYTNGIKVNCDYMGNLYFYDSNGNSVPVKPYDTVLVSYSVKAFTSQHMNSALNLALQVINAQPGASKYQSVSQAPYYYDPAIIYGAAYYLLRSLLVQLTQRQRRLLLEDPDASMFGNIKEAAMMYKEDFEKLVEKLPISRYPGIRGIVVPEFNMPGGRSRFFRYIWNIGTGN